jgi:hypothetical protein
MCKCMSDLLYTCNLHAFHMCKASYNVEIMGVAIQSKSIASAAVEQPLKK